MIAFAVAFIAIGAWTGDPWVGLAAGAAAGVVSVWFYPTTKCWWCGPRGGPRRMDSSETNWHNCLACGGSGRRKRLGAMIWGGIDG